MSSSDAILQHRQIKRRLVNRIGQDWKAGDRLPPIHELAREMGVGENSAYKAVRELRDEGILASRPRIGTVVTERPRGNAPKPAVEKSIQVRMSPDRDGMLHVMAHAFATEMHRRGRAVTFSHEVHSANASEKQINFSGCQDDAVVLFNSNELGITGCDEGGPVFSLLDTSGLLPRRMTSRYDMVGPNNEQGGMVAGEAMRRFEIADPCFVGVVDAASGDYRSVDAARLEGFQRGYGRSLKRDRLFKVGEYAPPAGAFFAREFAQMKSRPDALFVSSDDIASGFTLGALTLGIKPRDDFQLIGFDGQSAARAACFGGITTVAVPAEAMGRQAAEFLDMRLDQPNLAPRSISLGCSLKRGKTTPKPANPNHPFWNEDTFKLALD